VFLIQAAIIIQVLLVFLGIALAFSNVAARIAGFHLGWSGISFGVSLMSLVGWWWLSSPDPAYSGSNDGSTARKVVRATVIINAAGTFLPLIFGKANPAVLAQGGLAAPGAALSAAASIASTIAWVVWFFAAMRYLQWLAPRLPNVRVLERAKLMMWLGPVLYTVGMLFCGIGPLVALVLYYNLLDWVRNDLKAIRTGNS